ncbi:MAG: hypothetical protein AABY07_00140 [Nanoarchaeota archaeon]
MKNKLEKELQAESGVYQRAKKLFSKYNKPIIAVSGISIMYFGPQFVGETLDGKISQEWSTFLESIVFTIGGVVAVAPYSFISLLYEDYFKDKKDPFEDFMSKYTINKK